MENFSTSMAFTKAVTKTNLLGFLTRSDWMTDPIIIRQMLNAPKEVHPAIILPVIYKINDKLPLLFEIMKTMTFQEKVMLIQRSGASSFTKPIWEEFEEIEKSLLQFLIAEHPEVFGTPGSPDQVIKMNIPTGRNQSADVPCNLLAALLHYDLVPMILNDGETYVPKSSPYYDAENDMFNGYLGEKGYSACPSENWDDLYKKGLGNLSILQGFSPVKRSSKLEVLDKIMKATKVYVIDDMGDDDDDIRNSQDKLIAKIIERGFGLLAKTYNINLAGIDKHIEPGRISGAVRLNIYGDEPAYGSLGNYTYKYTFKFSMSPRSRLWKYLRAEDHAYDTKWDIVRKQRLDALLKKFKKAGSKIEKIERGYEGITFTGTIATQKMQVHVTRFNWSMVNDRDDIEGDFEY